MKSSAIDFFQKSWESSQLSNFVQLVYVTVCDIGQTTSVFFLVPQLSITILCFYKLHSSPMPPVKQKRIWWFSDLWNPDRKRPTDNPGYLSRQGELLRKVVAVALQSVWSSQGLMQNRVQWSTARETHSPRLDWFPEGTQPQGNCWT